MSTSTPRTATLGAPPPRARSLGAPPAVVQTKNNLVRPEIEQLNCRVTPEMREEIWFAARRERKTLGEYLVMCHEFYQNQKQKRG